MNGSCSQLDKANLRGRYNIGVDQPLLWHNSRRLTDNHAVAAVKRTAGPDLVIQGSSTLYPGFSLPD